MIRSLLQCGTKNDRKTLFERNTYIRELEKKVYREGVYVVCICSIYTVSLYLIIRHVYIHTIHRVYTLCMYKLYIHFLTLLKRGGFFVNEC
jgi:hypothetical protein